MRTFEYRLYVNKEQSCLLMGCLIESRQLYNEMLSSMKQHYEQNGTFPSKYDLNKQFTGRGGKHVPESVVQCLSDRLSKALKRFLAAHALGQASVGFPRFKQPNRWHSIQLRQYHHIAVEDLRILNMVKNHHLAKSIMDASWGAFLAILEAKAASAGHQVIRVSPRFTTQACNKCGALIQKSLSVRTHICTSCGYMADRDVNAAKNILLQAGALPSGTVSAGSPVELRSPRL